MAPNASQCQSCTTQKALKQTAANSKSALAPMCVKPKHFRDWDGAHHGPLVDHGDHTTTPTKTTGKQCTCYALLPIVPTEFNHPYQLSSALRGGDLCRVFGFGPNSVARTNVSLCASVDSSSTTKRRVLLTSPSECIERHQHGQRAFQVLHF